MSTQNSSLVPDAGVLEPSPEKTPHSLQLEQARTEAARAKAELEQFISIAGHDLKAPLRGLASLSQWIEEDLARGNTQEVSQHLRLLGSRIHRMNVLVDGLLQYSRADREPTPQERVNVEALLDDIFSELAPPERVRLKKASSLPVLTAERAPLRLVLLHLVANAIKHSGRPDVTILVDLAPQGPFWEFRVIDDGSGIAPQFQERIWGMLQTLQARDIVEGAGMGLAIVRKLVQRRGGRAWVESSPGTGATFGFTWPAREETGV